MLKRQNTKRLRSEDASNIPPLPRAKPCSGHTSGLLRRKNCRFGVFGYSRWHSFTVDFDAGMLCCADWEFRAPLSLPFCDILSAEPLPSQRDAQCWAGLFGLPEPEKEEQCDFILLTKAKRMELQCTSAAECRKWIRTIQDIIAQYSMLHIHTPGHTPYAACHAVCNEDDDSDQSTRTCSRESTSDEWEQDSEEQSDFDQAVHSTLCKVPPFHVAEPGRCFSSILQPQSLRTVCSNSWKRLKKPTPDSPGSCIQDDMSSPTDKESSADESKVDTGPHEYADLPLRQRLLARGKGPLPRNIQTP
eukprot:gnl/MRDRNA2_/MRDRNA2_91503_c0_seq1.p1 gnl/MRDRNA2_/MRDRNA2_91503_c0~~gnl/MRDRNA2_/MRDRNA2_91503_c0_seq1.p1  ORF type:complete len:303 (+),score=30.58 gnl/MRDRNA2_/MRDRNA2_91503_c0_seq1:78-986(+)